MSYDSFWNSPRLAEARAFSCLNFQPNLPSANNMMASGTPFPGSKGGDSSGQKAKLPPATPVYVLRGHASPIHALNFYAQNSRLISGDADGWIVVWDMATKRPAAAWKSHDAAVLGVRGVDYPRSDVDGGIETRIFTYVSLSTLQSASTKSVS
jgi:WD40 repeat protein